MEEYISTTDEVLKIFLYYLINANNDVLLIIYTLFN